MSMVKPIKPKFIKLMFLDISLIKLFNLLWNQNYPLDNHLPPLDNHPLPLDNYPPPPLIRTKHPVGVI